MLKRQFRGVSFSPQSPTTRSLSRKRTTFGAERPLHPHVTAHDKGRNNDAETKRLIIYQSTATARTMHDKLCWHVGCQHYGTNYRTIYDMPLPARSDRGMQSSPTWTTDDRPTIRDGLLNPNGLGSLLPTHTHRALAKVLCALVSFAC